MALNTEEQALTSSGGADHDLEKAMLAYATLTHQDLSRNLFAEGREWYESALFYQRRQWLKWDDSNKRWSLVKVDKQKPRPMPVTNHFARTINAVTNQLASGKPKKNGVPLDDSDANRRAAEYAEKACKAIDKESNADLLWPILGKHSVLWGMGVTKDYWDSSSSNGTIKIPQLQIQSQQMLGCIDCGNVANISPDMAANPGAPAPEQQGAPCPSCNSMQTIGWQEHAPVPVGVKQFSKGRICTEVRPLFEMFIPRDCQNPNLAKVVQQRYRMPLSEAKRMWGDRAKDLKADQKQETPEIYLDALRSLVNYNYMHDQTNESISVTETWVDFGRLPEKLQDQLRDAVQSQQMDLDDDDEKDNEDKVEGVPEDDLEGVAASTRGDEQDADPEQQEAQSEMLEAPDGELDPIEQLEQWGIYIIDGGSKILDWGINNLEGKKPFTFYLWEVDPANPYPKGLGVDLVPIQKRLNRIDSLMELGMMSNAAGKWLWPQSQTTQPPNGSPSDVALYDNIGDGKVKPEFIQPSPFHAACFSLRAAILQDFMTIGMTEGIQQGTNPQGVDSFRGLAYLGAKAGEQISTQRFLWETAHALRYEKCLILARRNWDQTRKVKVAGFNGRWGMQEMMGRDLEGDYILEIQPDSSRPQSLTEKEQAFQMLLEGGLVDPTDSATREYIVDLANLDNVNLVNHLQYMKAERDLDNVIAGNIPAINPYCDPQIFLKVFSSFTLTEDFEQLEPDAQQRVLMATQMISMEAQAQQAQMMAQAAAMGAGPGGPGQQLGNAMGKKNQSQQKSGLNGVPGKTTSPENSSSAATAEGNQIASQLP